MIIPEMKKEQNKLQNTALVFGVLKMMTASLFENDLYCYCHGDALTAVVVSLPLICCNWLLLLLTNNSIVIIANIVITVIVIIIIR